MVARFRFALHRTVHLGILGIVVIVTAPACAGGQSGNEGERPAAPCARGGTMLQGTVSEMGSGCVGVHVERVVAKGAEIVRADGSVLFDGSAAPGEIVRGRLGSVYAYTHEFRLNEPVVVLVGTFDDDLGLQLLPVEGDVAQVHWSGRRFEAPIEELAAPDCDAKLQARFDEAAASGGASGDHTQPAPPDPAVLCSP